jgi:hypothetical protein
MNDTNEKSFITYCGVYCGSCGLRMTGVEEDERHLSHWAARLDSAEKACWTSCPGCRSGEHRADCDFRICASAKGHEHCIHCEAFPCTLHEEFNSDGVPHHAGSLASLESLKEVGPAAWLGYQRKRWTCACGAPLSWYLTHCLKCGAPSAPCVTRREG